jgi:hypothetical protein
MIKSHDTAATQGWIRATGEEQPVTSHHHDGCDSRHVPPQKLHQTSHPHSSLECQLSRSRHVNVVVTFPPFNVQRTAWQIHLALAIYLTLQNTRNNSCACACAARQGASCAALPDHHAHMAAAEDFDKLRVGACWEDGVVLKLGADCKDV